MVRVIELIEVTLVLETSVARALCSPGGCLTPPSAGASTPGNKMPLLAVPSQQLGTAAQ